MSKRKEKQLSAIRPTKGDRALDVFIITILVIIGILVTYPIWLVMIASVSDPAFISTGKVWIIPKGLNLDAYRKALREGDRETLTRLLQEGKERKEAVDGK